MLRSVFDSQLALLDAQLLVMGSNVEDAVVSAIQVLNTRDAEEAQRVMDADDETDRLEREIEGLCMNLLLTQQPVARDLRRVSSALKMVGDMERIGDMAADICRDIVALEGQLDPDLSRHLERMGRRACAIVHDALEAFVERDAEQAIRVIGEDEEINELFKKVKKDVIVAIQTEADPASNLVEALMIAKYLERIGDHAKNIAEWVEYSLTGHWKGESIV